MRRNINTLITLIVILSTLVYFDYRESNEFIIKGNILDALLITVFIRIAYRYVGFMDKKAEKRKEKQKGVQ